MEAKITKGEWYVSGDKYPTIQSKNTNKNIVVTYPTIATVNSTFISEEVYKANAKLIAAAPDLLTCLEKLLYATDSFDVDLFYPELSKAYYEIRTNALMAVQKATE